ncbi:fimbria/pilus outer membrane usher protein [Bordetella sp. BOR01]|uniref:fimbria/pilus outer membrane usher protein n=1 Tax=Bordetella sp. BOR01 TaxID=2854779 RepID=UPI001C438CFA|nr:fimbria/pilus outer membrane usher protein [Bordetella sp. BOR01]MBV7484288.1 fimbrial biogenesis outer membrane usher protein [Bordetella sp. BOR01]
MAGITLACAPPAYTAEVEFDDSFLRSPVDIRMFSKGTAMPAGVHRVDVTLNDAWKGRYRVDFRLPAMGADGAQPCFDIQLLDSVGFDLDTVGADVRAALQDGPVCQPLGEIVEGAQAVFDSAELRLDMTAPQTLLRRHARGYVSPELWDDGITAGMLQYDYLAYHTDSSASSLGSNTSHYLGLRAGLNVGKWRLRYRSALNAGSGRGTSYQGIAAYAERGIVPWRSRLTVGDAITDGQVFDSLSFRGLQLSSEDRMYADSQRGFAPVVQGIANSNARVRITQQGNLIYETTVPPGPFIIDDLYPTGFGGDLRVTITEADGSEHTFTVAFASMPELLRPGVTRYSLTAGQFRNNLVDDTPSLFMGTLRHGFSNVVTGYTGITAADGYNAIAGGVGLNTRLGAFSSDLIYARTELDDDDHNGHRIRLAYSNILPVVGTNVALAAYRYSSSGYYEATDAFVLRGLSGGDPDWPYRSLEDRRHRFQLSLTQTLPEGWGALSLNASRQDYWGRSGADTQFQAQYNNRFRKVNYGISAGRTRNLASGEWNNQVMLTLSVPLGAGLGAPNLSASYSRDQHSQGVQASVSGVAGSDNQFGYSAFASTVDGRPGPRETTGGASGSWSAPFANIGASASGASGYKQYSASISGGIVAYSGGVVLGPMLGDTAALVEARDARGARVTNYSGVRLDRRGRAIVPYLSPYRQNTVEIDPKGLSTDVEVKETSRRLAPTAGAIALVQFETESGYSVLMTLTDLQGNTLPFGAAVLDPQGNNIGFVAQAGQALVRLPARKGTISVRWGDEAEKNCVVPYDVTRIAAPRGAGFRELDATCGPAPGAEHDPD